MIIGDINYLLRVKGFRRGASGGPPLPDYSATNHTDLDMTKDESDIYRCGYADGVKARENYIKQINDEILGRKPASPTCDHKQYDSSKHGRHCPCGTMMWDGGD